MPIIHLRLCFQKPLVSFIVTKHEKAARRIDRTAAVLFPLIFLIFNAVFWPCILLLWTYRWSKHFFLFFTFDCWDFENLRKGIWCWDWCSAGLSIETFNSFYPLPVLVVVLCCNRMCHVFSRFSDCLVYRWPSIKGHVKSWETWWSKQTYLPIWGEFVNRLDRDKLLGAGGGFLASSKAYERTKMKSGCPENNLDKCMDVFESQEIQDAKITSWGAKIHASIIKLRLGSTQYCGDRLHKKTEHAC